MVPHGERARVRVRREVGAEPRQLRIEIEHSPQGLGFLEVRVQHDDMPRAEVVAVPAGGLVVRRDAEVAEVSIGGRVRVGHSAQFLVLVVTGGGVRALLESTPRRGVALSVVGRRALGIGIVPEREHRAGDGVDDLGGPSRVLEVQGRAALSNISGADQDLRGPGRRDDSGERVGSRGAVRARAAHPDRIRSGRGVGVVQRYQGVAAGGEPPAVESTVSPGHRPPASSANQAGGERDGRAGLGPQVGSGIHRRGGRDDLSLVRVVTHCGHDGAGAGEPDGQRATMLHDVASSVIRSRAAASSGGSGNVDRPSAMDAIAQSARPTMVRS